MEGPSLEYYRRQLVEAAEQVDRSIEQWQARKQAFIALLEEWQAFPQLARNPVDGLRLDFLEQELAKHKAQQLKCHANLKKFDDLERQMRALALDEKGPALENTEECIDIQEELDDNDNVVSVKLTPQRHAAVEALTAESESLVDDRPDPSEGEAQNGAAHKATESVQPLEGMPTFTLVPGANGQMEMVADNAGSVPQVAMLQDLQAMNEICQDMEDEEEGEEDAFGRTRVDIPLPSLLERKKKIAFAEELHQGPSAGKLRPTTPILKRETKYPLPNEVITQGKGSLANLDLDPEEGAEKKPMIIRRLTDDELLVIRQKREAMGKKHKRRKSAEPSLPKRSGTWDEQGLDLPERPKTALDDGDTRTAKLARAKELLAAQDDIAWANAPISPEVTPQLSPVIGPPKVEKAADSQSQAATTSMTPSVASDSAVISPAVTPVIAPKPRKPPTPERRGSYNANIPSPLSQCTTAPAMKEVQFSETVQAKLAPLAEEENVLPTVVERRERKKPPADRQPSRQSSIDPMVLSPMPRSPPPQNRERGPVNTEGQGSVSHFMVRSTPKSPPPHIAIHDLLGDQSSDVNNAIRGEALGYFEKQSPEPPHPDEILPASVKEHQVMTNEIIERSGQPALLSEEQHDEAELALHKKEAAQAYHKLRSRMIQAQGGYIEQEEETEEVPLEEKPKMSRFKAARLARTQ